MKTLIKNARIYDGSGSEGYLGEIDPAGTTPRAKFAAMRHRFVQWTRVIRLEKY